METEPYLEQRAHWPKDGRAVLAHYDDDAIVVYQAFKPQIADEAVQLGRFGPSFSRSRMSWIKPNFLWMMYRCGWATKEGQEVVLALWIRRSGFDELLRSAVPSSHDPARFPDPADWKRAIKHSDVRLQWDPDHAPGGTPETRRAVQLGLRGATLARFADEWLLHVEDITPIVRAQHPHAQNPYRELLTPAERVYPVTDPAAITALGLAP